MNKVVCSFRRFHMGGVETYFIRIFKWCIENKYQPVLLLPEGQVYDSVWEEELNQLNVEILHYSYTYKVSKEEQIKKLLGDKKDFWFFISTTKDTYYASFSLIQNYKIKNSRLYFYVLHPWDTIEKNSIIKQKFFKYFLIKPLWESGLIFMDEETENYCKRHYTLKKDKNGVIVRLGKSFEKCNRPLFQRNSNHSEFTIMSICRFDFPFKGYVFGLISDFQKLCNLYKNLKLVLVGDGSGRKELEKYISGITPDVRDRIVLKGLVPYQELDLLLESANLYVGLGTTLIDAAKKGIVSIVAAGEQRENYAVGFFHDDISIVGLLLEEIKEKHTFYELIKVYIETTEEEKQALSKRTYDTTYKEYEINKCMRKLFKSPGKPTYIVKIGFLIRKNILKIKHYLYK